MNIELAHEVRHGESLRKGVRVQYAGHPERVGVVFAGWGVNSREIAVLWDGETKPIDGYAAEQLELCDSHNREGHA